MTADKEIEAYFSRMIPNYAFAMKEHLRDGVKLEELELTDEEKIALEKVNHKTSGLLKMMYEKLHQMKKENIITMTSLIKKVQEVSTLAFFGKHLFTKTITGNGFLHSTYMNMYLK